MLKTNMIHTKELKRFKERTAIRDLMDRHLATEEQLLGRLFRGYFNNKMSVLVFLIQARRHKPESKVIIGMYSFLDDMYHHMLESRFQGRYRRVFVWFKLFLRKLPNVRISQRVRAVGFVQDLYETFGINLKLEVSFQEGQL